MDICTFCDGHGYSQDAEMWPCDICEGTGMADERLMELEWACAGLGRLKCEACGKPNYRCECEHYADEWEVA